MSCAGILVIVVSALNIINIQELINIVRNIWNCIFGTLMILLQLNWKQMITRNFGFLNNWVLRALFYIFVGTNIMNDSQPWLTFFTFSVGFGCIFIGIIELLFGFQCAEKAENGDDEEAAKKRAGNAVDPGGVQPVVTVNLNPNQVAAAGSWAASNAGTLAAAAGGGSSGGPSDNPFFGNQHAAGR